MSFNLSFVTILSINIIRELSRDFIKTHTNNQFFVYHNYQAFSPNSFLSTFDKVYTMNT